MGRQGLKSDATHRASADEPGELYKRSPTRNHSIHDGVVILVSNRHPAKQHPLIGRSSGNPSTTQFCPDTP